MNAIQKKILVISGPTASGKSYLAEELQKKSDKFIIINADSMQVYKELPILSAQPSPQSSLRAQRGNLSSSVVRQVDCHLAQLLAMTNGYELYSFLNFYENCSAGIWLKSANKIIKETFASGNQPVIVGGTGLYIKALLEGIVNIPEIKDDVKKEVEDKFTKLGKEKFHAMLASIDTVAAKKIHSNDAYRMQRAMEVYAQTGKTISSFKNSTPSYDAIHISIEPTRETLYKNCAARFQEMLKAGAAEEVKLLNEKIKNRPGKYNIENTLGYRSIVSYLNGELSLKDATQEANQATRNYAKRQCTWFKNQFKNKVSLQYVSDVEEIKEKFLDTLFKEYKFF